MELKKVLLGIEGIKARGNLDLDIVGIEKNSKEGVYVYCYQRFFC